MVLVATDSHPSYRERFPLCGHSSIREESVRGTFLAIPPHKQSPEYGLCPGCNALPASLVLAMHTALFARSSCRSVYHNLYLVNSLNQAMHIACRFLICLKWL